MSLNLKLLQVSGIVAPPEIKASSFRMTLYRLYFICCNIIYFPVLLGQILALYHFWGDIDVTTNSIFNLLGALMSFIEAAYARFNARQIAKLFETFENQVMPKMSSVGLKEKHYIIFDSAAKKARLVTLIFMAILDVMLVSWIPAPFIKHLKEENRNVTHHTTDEIKWLNFCYIIWFPIDITMSPYFEIMYLIQCVVFIIATTYRKAIDATVAAMMLHISAQFEILYTALEDMDETVLFSEKETNGGELPFLEQRELFGRVAHTSLEDRLQLRGLGLPSRQGIHEWKATDNAINTDIKDEERGKEDLPQLAGYLANIVKYHQTIIE